ncbi:MAG: pyruvate dehydrogenase complex dihydrolipoamide acetyltransferase [Chitinophagaceae bacterium]|nr:pyruvate dehydrogenase complex dihydrolipoamide acetyltransferase [Chitinophagaceae bacterium]
MPEKILMPRLSDTMEVGVIAAWHKNVGDTVKKGDLLAEIETDKATMDLESYKDGVLLHRGGDVGAKIKVDDLLAIIGKKGEDISTLLDNKTTPAEKKPTPVQEEPKQTATEKKPAIDIAKMEEVVLMPRLSDTMEVGVIAAWHKKVGDAVKKGDVLAEIETDKATMDLESYKDGTLLYIGAKEGEKIPVNGLLSIIGDKNKVDLDAIVAASKATPVLQTTNQETETTDDTNISAAPKEVEPALAETNGRIKASPLAKKLAAEKSIDLSLIKGTGDGGRIIKADVDNFTPTQKAAAATTVQNYSGSTEEGFTDIPNSQMRNVIAKRLGESKFTAPHFYLTMEINMDNAMAARQQLNELSPVKISFNDMIVKAAALALRQHPAINASWMPATANEDGKIRRYKHIHIGIAVAIDDGLIVPVIRFADNKTLPQIAGESKELAGKAKNKKLQPNEFSGNTFTISNLGMMDIDEFTAIINPPDSCIMAVGRIKEIVVKKETGFDTAQVMKVTMSCDHRSVDGATGAAFLQTFKKYMENPITMLL